MSRARAVIWCSVIVVVPGGCTTVDKQVAYPASPQQLDALQAATAGRNSVVTFTPGHAPAEQAPIPLSVKGKVRLDGKMLRVTLPWEAPVAIPLSDVQRIETRNRARGAMEGCGIGGLTMAAAGALLAGLLAQGGHGDCPSCPADSNTGTFVLIGGFEGAAVGALLGWLVGARDRYSFAAPITP